MTLTQDEISKIVSGRINNAFELLGLHYFENKIIARAFIIGAQSLIAFDENGKELGELKKIHDDGLFEGFLNTNEFKPITYRANANDKEWLITCPYSFAPVHGPIDDYLINEGRHLKLYEIMGAHIINHQNYDGVHFALWAPNAARVALIGDFNNWNCRQNIMRKRFDTGIWEIFIPNIGEGRLYKFQIFDKDENPLPQKSDPFAFQSELRPNTASIVAKKVNFKWDDKKHLDFWNNQNNKQLPISIYEVHAGSWKRGYHNEFLNWKELSETLLPYVIEMGFTHIEFLPISEHPLDASWGYQAIGLYAPSARYGNSQDFANFVNNAHKAGIGIIIDWVPAHFPSDEHGLHRFDGTALYEHEDKRLGFHPDWTTYIYNFGRKEVMSYLVNNALYWADYFHIDGIRVDAVASMLYRDYSRKSGEWIPNSEGGRENWEAVQFLQTTNYELKEKYKGLFTIAEESTTWNGVTKNNGKQALGFDFKWNMGFMNDSLRYMARDPIHRKYHHEDISFGLTYAFSENFVLPLSHDEVVHGKGTLINKMSGDEWQKFANLRAYYGFMWAYPGKKLLFMGQEFAQLHEWSEERALDWELIDNYKHKGVQKLIKDLNNIYKNYPSLHYWDCDKNGFEWVKVDDKQNSVFGFIRIAPNQKPIFIITNFSNQNIKSYNVTLPKNGKWIEILNTDAIYYGGNGEGNLGFINCEYGNSTLTMPALTTLFFEHEGG